MVITLHQFIQIELNPFYLIHVKPMFQFYNPWKHQKTWVFRWYKNRTLAWNYLISRVNTHISSCRCFPLLQIFTIEEKFRLSISVPHIKLNNVFAQNTVVAQKTQLGMGTPMCFFFLFFFFFLPFWSSIVPLFEIWCLFYSFICYYNFIFPFC